MEHRVNHRAPMLDVEALRHAYGSGPSAHLAIENVSFSVGEGELVSIVGPSGCGKTTLLKAVSGLLTPSGGTVSLLGKEIRAVPDDLALVFQDYSRSLFPWMRVRANVDFPLGRKGLTRAERRARVEESLSAVGLLEFADRYPWQLSGGMQQRTAIARALAYRPRILLMDEPFASVDAQTRADLEDLVLDVRRKFAMTILFVTHDVDESVYLADRVLVLSKSPSRIVSEVAVDLPEPRDQISTKETQRFVQLRAEVARRIRRPPTSHTASPAAAKPPDRSA
jgi:NitT/TauT family transport system ATP-binding protein